MTLSEYALLKQQIVVGVGSSEKHGELVKMIKRLFKDEINSPRRYEQIKTIGELLEILEIRDELSENKVNLLEYIVRRLPDNEELSKKIQDYKAAHPVSSDNINHYASQSRPAPSYTDTHSNFMMGYSTGMSPRKANRIHMTLVEEIGTHWRDLGRNLGVAQGKIDNIDASNETLKSKACTLLQQYEKMADPQRWFFHLCDALESTRRRDLSRKIQEIMAMALSLSWPGLRTFLLSDWYIDWPGSDRYPVTSEQDDLYILAISLRNHHLNSIQEQLSKVRGLTVSDSTIRTLAERV